MVHFNCCCGLMIGENKCSYDYLKEVPHSLPVFPELLARN